MNRLERESSDLRESLDHLESLESLAHINSIRHELGIGQHELSPSIESGSDNQSYVQYSDIQIRHSDDNEFNNEN